MYALQMDTDNRVAGAWSRMGTKGGELWRGKKRDTCNISLINKILKTRMLEGKKTKN